MIMMTQTKKIKKMFQIMMKKLQIKIKPSKRRKNLNSHPFVNSRTCTENLTSWKTITITWQRTPRTQPSRTLVSISPMMSSFQTISSRMHHLTNATLSPLTCLGSLTVRLRLKYRPGSSASRYSRGWKCTRTSAWTTCTRSIGRYSWHLRIVISTFWNSIVKKCSLLSWEIG